MADLSQLHQLAQEEEALIRVYEAELSILKQRQEAFSPRPDNNNDIAHDRGVGSDDDDDDDGSDPLDWMFAQEQLASKLEESDSRNLNSPSKEECTRLTQSIQGFVFTSLEHDCGSTQYILGGYFIASPSISASIELTVEIVDHNNERTRKRQRRKCGAKGRSRSRVVGLKCQLSSSCPGEDLSYIPVPQGSPSEKNSTNSNTYNNKSLPDWIAKMSHYLEFEQERKKCIEQWQRKYECHSEYMGMKVEIQLVPRRGEQHDSSEQQQEQEAVLPSFCWEWKWDEERDVLYISEKNALQPQEIPGDPIIRNDGLQDLVTCTDSCEKALDVILASVSPSE
jgi:hypothetical protein